MLPGKDLNIGKKIKKVKFKKFEFYFQNFVLGLNLSQDNLHFPQLKTLKNYTLYVKILFEFYLKTFCEYITTESELQNSLKLLKKITWIVLNTIFFNLKKFFKNFREYIRMENLDYKNENIERKFLEYMQNNQFLKVKNSLLELEKDFMELKDRKMKDREEKIKRGMDKLFYKLIIASKGDMDTFEEQEMKKVRPI